MARGSLLVCSCLMITCVNTCTACNPQVFGWQLLDAAGIQVKQVADVLCWLWHIICVNLCGMMVHTAALACSKVQRCIGPQTVRDFVLLVLIFKGRQPFDSAYVGSKVQLHVLCMCASFVEP